MKPILSLFIFALLFNFQSNAQDKEELLEIFEILSELSEVQALYQHDLPDGRSLVFQKPTSRSFGRANWNEKITNALFEIRNDDMYSFSNPVTFLTVEEAQAFEIDPQFLTTTRIIYKPTEVKIILNAELWETIQVYAGQFSFIRETEDDDWEINSKNFEIRRAR